MDEKRTLRVAIRREMGESICGDEASSLLWEGESISDKWERGVIQLSKGYGFYFYTYIFKGN
jgi:hypothetical protein